MQVCCAPHACQNPMHLPSLPSPLQKKKRSKFSEVFQWSTESLPRAYHLLTPGGGDDRPRERANVSCRYENRKVKQKQVQRPDFVGFQRLKCSNSL